MTTKRSRSLKDQTEAVFSLARHLQNQLADNDKPETLAFSSETLNTLEKNLDRLSLLADTASSSTCRKLDNEGTKIWNLCAERMRTTKDYNDIVLLCKVKAFAYAMLEAAAPRTDFGNYRSLELAFRGVKACLRYGLTDLSQKMMASAAARLDMLQQTEKNADNPKLSTFTTEYYMLRIHVAWSQGRADIADHLFSKTPEIKTKEQQEVVVDICYSIGNAALSTNQNEPAATWLGRALTACESVTHDGSYEVDRSFGDKKLVVLHAFGEVSRAPQVLGF
ncbi:hypothetical protein BJX61DRAFT_358643 [Aspergillus egyptiacus]|nr:hypothetical protein BJX61DRAFT_358643 [Aspergillus egyptiacus]